MKKKLVSVHVDCLASECIDHQTDETSREQAEPPSATWFVEQTACAEGVSPSMYVVDNTAEHLTYWRCESSPAHPCILVHA